MNAKVRVESSEMNVEENIGEPKTNDNVYESSENSVDSNSDSEDIDYEVSKSTSYEYGFTDSENDLEDDVVSRAWVIMSLEKSQTDLIGRAMMKSGLTVTLRVDILTHFTV
ncbi:hypothetical protein V6N13_107071 [Hibiscus sabdariffa]|uniref:Uncharacterized protein n=1 Tax=Hibiscus sabdariffa TaxID=183260 RepID=A0ABR2F2M4_9ROSI